MLPLLVASLLDGNETASSDLATLIALDMGASARQRNQEQTLAAVHDRLDAAGVTHTFIKGAVSAWRWFPDPAQRPYADIDVVVQAGEQFAGAVQALDPLHPLLPLIASPAANSISSVNIEFEGTWVDIQTDSLRNGLTPIDKGWVVGTDELIFRSGIRIRVLDPEHDLVMFLLHQERDRFRYLLGVAEARYRLQHQYDWEVVEAISRKEGIWEQVGVALEALSEELGTDTPVLPPDNWRTTLWRKLWRKRVRLRGELSRFKYVIRARWLMPVTARGRVLEALVWAFRTAFPPEPILRQQYPTARGPYLWQVLANRVGVRWRRRMWVWKQTDA